MIEVACCRKGELDMRAEPRYPFDLLATTGEAISNEVSTSQDGHRT